MSLQLPRSGAGRGGAFRRVSLLAVLGASVVALAGCGAENRDDWKNLAMPAPATEQGTHNLDLWQGAWVAALITGAIVWGLIFFAIWRFRRRSEDEIPIQTRYNLPLEILYTIVPVLMVIVFFRHTVDVQNIMLDEVQEPDNIVEVTAQQWQWTFNHGVGEPDYAAEEDPADTEYAYDEYAYEVGTASYIPTLYLPVDRTTRFNLHSPDVIHDFGIPGFLMKMDVIPGRVNHFEVKPTKVGNYSGKCYELCGTYHSRMLFNVEVVPGDEYDRYVEELAQRQSSSTPLLGGENADTQAGIPVTDDDDPEGEGK